MYWSGAHGLPWWNIRKGISTLTFCWRFRVGVALSICSLLIFDAWLNSIRLLTFLVLADEGSSKRGCLVEWVEKASFVRLNKLFEITTTERNHHKLISARNLLAVVQEPQSYVLNILPSGYRKSWYLGSTSLWRIFPTTKRLVRRTRRLTRNASSSGRKKCKKGNWGRPPIRKVVAHVCGPSSCWGKKKDHCKSDQGCVLDS